MKVSISLPDKDLAFIDRQIAHHGEPSRSAVVHKALERLKLEQLEEAYAQRWAEWDEEDDIWDVTAADGLEDDSDEAW